MNALTPIAPPAGYCDALRIAWHSTDPAEVMHAHCAALDELLANPADLACLAGRGRLTALAETLRLAAARFAPASLSAPRGPRAFATPASTDLPRACQRGEFHWTLHQESVFRPLVQQYGADAEWLRNALLACCQGDRWRILTGQELALAATQGGYDARHLAAVAAALQASPLVRRLRTGLALTLLAEAQECLA